MPGRRTAHGAPRENAVQTPGSWRPIRLVRVDLDRKTADADPDLAPGDRAWVEVIRAGQVVGLVEARLGDEGSLAGTEIDELARTFDGPTVPSAEAVADADLPFASVVVPTLCRRPDQLARTIASLDRLDYPSYEIVLVDNRAGRAAQPLPAFPPTSRVRVIEEGRPGISAARNRGVAESTGDVVAFTDDDASVDPGWLRALGARFVAEPGVDALGGLVLPSELDTEPQLWFEEYYGGFSQSFDRSTVSVATEIDADPLFPYAPGRFGAGCNMAFRRSVLEHLGGFDPTLGTGTPARGGEDLSIFITLLVRGGTSGFEPAAVVRHSHRRTEQEFLHLVRTYGTGLSAMYTSLVVHEPRAVLELLRRVPPGVRLLTRSRDDRSPSATPTYPRRASLYQLLGMATGPFAYARSWLLERRLRSART